MMDFITSINPKNINKDIVDNWFSNERVSPEQLYDLVTKKGYAFCVSQLVGETKKINRESSNFHSSQVIAIDIDNKDEKQYISYQQMLENSLVKKFASFIYATPTHTDDKNRYRVVFVLDKEINDKKLYEKYVTVMIRYFKSDEATKSCVQMFFGTKDCQLSEFIGKILPISILEKLTIKYDNLLKNKKLKPNTIIETKKDNIVKDEVVNSNMDYKKIIKYIFKNGRLNNDEWFKVITALKNYSGLSDKEIKEEISKYVELGDIDIKLKNAHKYKDIKVGSIFHLAQRNGFKINSFLNGCISYNEDIQSNGVIKYNSSFDLMKLRNQINDFGYLCISDKNCTNYCDDKNLNKIINYNISKVNKKDIINTIEHDIIKSSGFPEEAQSQLFTKILGGNVVGNLVKLINTKSLSDIEKNLFKDENLLTKLAFRNGYLEIEPLVEYFSDWAENSSYVYEDQIIPYDYKEADDKKSECQRFFECISTSYDPKLKILNEIDKDKYNALCSIFGYLLINYKDKSFTKCVFLTDEDDSNHANGGTGKSIFIKLLKEVRNVTERDGKNFDPKSRFNFDNINTGCDVYAINDINYSFDIKSIYNLITDGFTYEKKGRDSITMTFEQSPKVLITSNHTHLIQGHSDTRRTEVFEFSNYFSTYRTVKDEFGHLMIEDWDDDEYMRFFKFCIHCIKLYYFKLSSTNQGIPIYDKSNYIIKQIKKMIGDDFFEFFEENITLHKLFKASDLIAEYKQHTGEEITSTLMTQRLSKYSKNMYGLDLQKMYSKEEGCKIYLISEKDIKDFI